MMKVILALVVGLAGGYYLGYADGADGKPSIAARVVSSVGGKSRAKVGNDIDATMQRVEGDAKTDPKKAGKAP
jgi:hypothetical protein